MKQFVFFLILFSYSIVSTAQISIFETPVSINSAGSNSDASAMMDIKSTDRGILIPRMSTAQVSSISNPAIGLLVYDTNVNVFKYYNGSIWEPIVSTAAGVNGSGDIIVTGNNGVYNVSYTDADKDNTNEVQFISKNGNTISLSAIQGLGGGTVTLDDNDPTNEIQNLIYNYANNRLTISNNNNTNVIDLSSLATDNQNLITPTFDSNTNNLSLSIEDGNTTNVDLSQLNETVQGANDINVMESNGVFTVDYSDGDKSDTNESQTLTKSGSDVVLTSANGAGGGTITLNDDDATNEIQALSYDSNTQILGITNNAISPTIDLSVYDESVIGNNDITVTENNGIYTVDYSDGDKSDTNESQTLTKSGAEISLTMANGAGGGIVTLNDDSPSNEIQDLTYDATTNVLKVTNNTSATDIDLTELEESVTGDNDIIVTESNGVYTVDYTDGDKSDTNESQFIFKANNVVTLSPANNVGGGSFTLEDDNATNELQTISRDGLTVSLTDGGTYQDSILTEAIVDAYADNNGYLESEVDGSVTNELQTISRSGLTVSLTDGGTYQDSILTEAIVDAYADNNGYLESEVDGSVTNEIQDLEYNATTQVLKVTNNASATDITLTSLMDDLGDHTATQDIVMDTNALKLMGNSDTKNALRYAGASSMFNSFNPGGPAIYGLNGGVLGTTNNQDSIILSWSENGRVGINNVNPANELDVNGKVTLSQSTGDEMVIINDNEWIHSTGIQDMSFGSEGGDHFIIGSKEGSDQGSGIYGDGDHLTLWTSGEDLENPNAFLYIVDTDKMDNDNDPYDNSAVVAYLNSSGNWVAASDINRKENIEPLRGSLDKILSVNGYSYHFKRTAGEIEKGMQAPHALGVIAQEVIDVIPEVVETKSNGEQFVSYSEFIPLLIESIKEQQAQIEDLKSEINAIKNKK